MTKGLKALLLIYYLPSKVKIAEKYSLRRHRDNIQQLLIGAKNEPCVINRGFPVGGFVSAFLHSAYELICEKNN